MTIEIMKIENEMKKRQSSFGKICEKFKNIIKMQKYYNKNDGWIKK